MIDDYAPTYTRLKPKPTEQFGLGGSSDFGLGSTTGGNPDIQGAKKIGPSEPFDPPVSPTDQNTPGNNGGSGIPTGTGIIKSDEGAISFIGGSAGDIVYHDGDDWVVLEKKSQSVLITTTEGVPEWIENAGQNSIIYLSTEDSNWKCLPAPQDQEVYVLGFKDGEIQWLDTESCDDEEE